MPPPPPPNASDAPRPDEAFLAVFERFRGVLERVVAARIPKRLRAKFGASDVVQEAWMVVLRRPWLYQGRDPASPEVGQDLLRLCMAVSLLKLREFVRRFGRTAARAADREVPIHGVGPDHDVAAAQRSPLSEAEALEAESEIRDALDELPPDQRLAVVLINIGGRTDADAGASLGRSAEAVRKLRRRAIRALTAILARKARVSDLPETALEDRGPDAVGAYVLRRPLGEGAMGRVFAARRADGTGPEVAVKVLHRDVARSPALVARFRDEATISARIDGPGVVRVLEVIEAGGPDAPVAIVFELVEGRTLRKVGDADRPIPPARWLRIARSAAAAVATLHAHGVVHRDLKPENLLVRADDSVVVTDLGLARALDAANRRTASGTFVGTRWYAAPEQFRGPRDAVGPASDVYVLALTLHELWTGRHPFGDGADAVDRSITGRPPAASKARPGLPRGADELLARCLDPERANRPRDGRALAEALEAVGGAA